MKVASLILRFCFRAKYRARCRFLDQVRLLLQLALVAPILLHFMSAGLRKKDLNVEQQLGCWCLVQSSSCVLLASRR